MKLDCPRKEFFEAVSAAASAASVRTSVTILQNLKIVASDHGIQVSGCDGEMWVERNVPCFVSEPGSICVQARLLNDLVSSMPDGDIHLQTLEGNAVLLTQGASEYRMVSLDAEDFPEVPEFIPENQLKLRMGVLRNAVESVLYAVSTDHHRVVLTGVLFTYNGTTLTLVATDTARMAVRKMELPGIGNSVNAVVPEKALKSIKTLPISDDVDVELIFGGGRIAVESGGAKVVSQLLAGTYPNWERVVPNETTRTWSVEADQLLEKVKRTMILARDSANRVRFQGQEDLIRLSAHSEEKGEAKEEVAMVSQNGNVEIAFNGRYVQDVLGAIDGPGVRIEMTESSRPAVFRPGDDESGYFCVIMPMALQ
jgi:DNA polymerase-3 subunit beta